MNVRGRSIRPVTVTVAMAAFILLLHVVGWGVLVGLVAGRAKTHRPPRGVGGGRGGAADPRGVGEAWGVGGRGATTASPRPADSGSVWG